MSTRHASVQGPYPLTESSFLDAFLLDCYFVVQGVEDSIDAEESDDLAIYLEDVTKQSPTSIRLLFNVYKGPLNWNIYFTIEKSETPNDFREVRSDHPVCEGVVIINESAIDFDASNFPGVSIAVESSRYEFHTEQVNSLSFKNIERCNGVEDDTTLYDVLTDANDLVLGPGYNTEVSFDTEDGVVFNADTALGQGLAPTLGNTDPACPALEVADLDFIATVNGLQPVGGNIGLTVSNSLALSVLGPGKFEIRRRQ